jgi:hypothetical protein
MPDAGDADDCCVGQARRRGFRPGKGRQCIVVAVPLMVIIMLMAMRADVMGRFVLPRALWAMGWLCTGAMTVAVGIMFATW